MDFGIKITGQFVEKFRKLVVRYMKVIIATECSKRANVFFRQDLTKYIGQWKNDKINGMGEYTYTEEVIYFGSWLNNKKSGFGHIFNPNGDTYTGHWSNDNYNGLGELICSNGQKYTGTLKEDKYGTKRYQK